MNLRIVPEAEEETREAAVWYEQQRPGLGLEFLAAVDTTIQRIRRKPARFSRLETLPDEESVRRALTDRFPYAVIFEEVEDEIRIIAAGENSGVQRAPERKRTLPLWMGCQLNHEGLQITSLVQIVNPTKVDMRPRLFRRHLSRDR